MLSFSLCKGCVGSKKESLMYCVDEMDRKWKEGKFYKG